MCLTQLDNNLYITLTNKDWMFMIKIVWNGIHVNFVNHVWYRNHLSDCLEKSYSS